MKNLDYEIWKVENNVAVVLGGKVLISPRIYWGRLSNKKHRVEPIWTVFRTPLYCNSTDTIAWDSNFIAGFLYSGDLCYKGKVESTEVLRWLDEVYLSRREDKNRVIKCLSEYLT